MDSLPAEPQGKTKYTGVGSLSLLQRVFLTQELNWGLFHCRQILSQLSYPCYLYPFPTFFQYNLFKILIQNRNLHSPANVRIVKARRKPFMSAVSTPSSSKKIWEGSQLPASLRLRKLCKGGNYKWWGGSREQVTLTKGGRHQREERQSLSL